MLSFSSNVNNLSNQGVGGLTLSEAGYSSLVRENTLRLSNTLIPNSNMLHETRIGYSWRYLEQLPSSTSPSLQVSGYFTGGGSTGQNLNNRERDLEMDDDLLITRGKHQVKFGVQSLGIFEHAYNPATTLTALMSSAVEAHQFLIPTSIRRGKQQRSAHWSNIDVLQNNLPGGTPTNYQVTSGNPLVSVTQWRVGLYLQDTIKLGPRFTVSSGLRYGAQTSPKSAANFGPRASFSWMPDKKQTWVFRARVGLFSGPTQPSYARSSRLNDVRQKKITVYSPNYDDPLRPLMGRLSGQSNSFHRHWRRPHIRRFLHCGARDYAPLECKDNLFLGK